MSHHRSWTWGALLGSAILAACGGSTGTNEESPSDGPQPPGGGSAQCEYAGRLYQPGEYFGLGDGCNRCECSITGVICTSMACATGGRHGFGVSQCEYEGRVYQLGQYVASTNGCNRCECTSTGISCTTTACATGGYYSGSGGMPASGGGGPVGSAGRGGAAASAGAASGGVSPLPEDGCVVGFRLDDCCEQPLIATAEELRGDACLWPAHAPITDEARALCPWPGFCAAVDCDFAPRPSRWAAPDAAGQCQYASECATDADCVHATDLRACCACPRVFPRVLAEADPCIYSESEGTAPPTQDCADCSNVQCEQCPELALPTPQCVMADSGLNACQEALRPSLLRAQTSVSTTSR